MKTKFLWIILSTLLIISMFSSSFNVVGDNHILPEVDDNATSPFVNGNITQTEWMESILLNTTIRNSQAQIRVTSNSSFLFIGLNFTVSDYVQVNNTAFNSSQSLNLQGHDWLAFQFDNNLDQASIGTSESPDDAIVIDQFNSSSYDGYLTGNSTKPFSIDTENNGTSDGFGVRVNETDAGESQLIYEFEKNHNSDDVKGSDINISQSKVLQFRVHSFVNTSSNASSTLSQFTQWFSIRINETGTGIALKEAGDTFLKVQTYGTADNFRALNTIIDAYGFNVTERADEDFSIETNDLAIIILGDTASFDAPQVAALSNHVRSGGKAMVFLSSASAGVSQNIASAFEISYLANNVLRSDNADGNLTISSFNGDLPFNSGSTLVTDNPLGSLELTSSAFNISEVTGSPAIPFIQGQEYQVYDLFSGSNSLIYDEDGDGEIDPEESFNELSLGIAIDFLKGGRLTMFASNELVSNQFMTAADNISFLLRALPWNARTINTLQVNSVEIDTNVVKLGENQDINIIANVTDEFGNSVDQAVVTIDLELAESVKESIILTQSDDDTFEGVLTVRRAGSMQIETTVFNSGYGFAEGETKFIISERKFSSFNDLDRLSTPMVLFFIVSFSLVIYTILRVNKFSPNE